MAELRETTGVKAGVSKVIQGVHDRVLTVGGTLEGVAKVCKTRDEGKGVFDCVLFQRILSCHWQNRLIP